MTSLVWFRQDLRLSDQPALVAAVAEGPVVPVYILDDETPALPVTGLTAVVRRTFPTVVVSAEEEAAVRVGRALPDRRLDADLVALLSPAEEFLALYRSRGGAAVAEAVFCG